MSFSINSQKILFVGDPLYKLPSNPPIDNEPPLITNFDYQIVDNKINISWRNDTSEFGSPEISYGELSYGNTPACEQSIKDTTQISYYNVEKENYLSEHHFTIDYDPSQDYYIKAFATDPAGNTSASSVLKVVGDHTFVSALNLKPFTYKLAYNLNGIKSADIVKVLVNGVEVTTDNENNTWNTILDLLLGENAITLTGKDQYGFEIEPSHCSMKRRKAADANDDSAVGLIDLSILSANWRKTSQDNAADFNEDGNVGLIDLSILAANWRK